MPSSLSLASLERGKQRSSSFAPKLYRSGGVPPFFLEIVDIAKNVLVPCFDPDEKVRLHAWKESRDVAVFFLATLNEVKLQNPTQKEALRNLRRALHFQWDRVLLVVSCRASDWMAEADLSATSGVAQARGDMRIVQLLAPLKIEQIERLAHFAGVTATRPSWTRSAHSPTPQAHPAQPTVGPGSPTRQAPKALPSMATTRTIPRKASSPPRRAPTAQRP